MGIRVLIFMSVVVAVIGAASVYVHRRAARLIGLGRRGRLALGAVLACGIALTVASRVLERWAPARLLEPLGVVGSVITLGTFLAAVLLAIVDLAEKVARVAARLTTPPRSVASSPPASSEAASPAAAARVSRREALVRAATGSA